ncbi:hypothetical protein AZE42_05136 [Rhizopogon vesiculosus]|uniref:Uncharacterized protein n=1 Tax=Rhizopogon vesiculosus TaxID=180088 RepID=A0A1J8PWN0_9AGAM|nr:hypothetical protein AZE42_05136 [Rhizopogon vesiculosus]
MRHLDQTHTLIATGSEQSGLEHASGPAPLLESITFTGALYEHQRLAYDTLVKFETPALRRLVLGRGIMLRSTNTAMIKDITHLDIIRTDMAYTFKTISLFQTSSSLKSLVLDIRCSPPAYALPITMPPSLSSIRLQGTQKDCSALLRKITASSVKEFTLTCSGHAKPDFKLPVLLAGVSALRLRNKPKMSLLLRPHQLFISMGEDVHSFSMVIRMAETMYSQDTTSSDSIRCQNHNWYIDFTYKTRYDSITVKGPTSVCKALCLDSVTDVTLQRISGSGVSAFCHALIEKMPALRSLTVRCSCTSAIIKAIQPSEIFQLEELSELCFEKLDFKDQSKQPGRDQDIIALIKVFRKRDEMGLNLPSLKLIECTSSGGNGLHDLKNTVMEMGVDYTEIVDTDPETSVEVECQSG